jgi:hypothetical protein
VFQNITNDVPSVATLLDLLISLSLSPKVHYHLSHTPNYPTTLELSILLPHLQSSCNYKHLMLMPGFKKKGLKLEILLLQPSECQDYRHAQPHLAFLNCFDDFLLFMFLVLSSRLLFK